MRKLLVVAALAAFATLFAGSKADAAFRVTLTDGTTTKYYYGDNNVFAVAGISIGNFNGAIQSSQTNFPGAAAIGSITQTFSFSTSGNGGNLTSTVEVINAIAALTGADREITAAGDLTALAGGTLATFTAPPGPGWVLSSDVSVSTNTSVKSGTAYNTMIANGTSLDSLTTTLNPAQGERIQFTTFGGGPGYTLTDILKISGVNGGVQSASVTSTGGVTAVPAPAGVLLLAAGAPFLGVLGLRRRKAAVKA